MDVVGTGRPAASSGAAKAFVSVAGPALIALVPMAVIPALPGMAQHFAPGGGGAFFAQMVMTAPAVMIIVATLSAGRLVDTIGRRNLMLASLVAYLAAGVGCLLLPDATSLIGARLALGFSAGLVMTCSMSMVADYPAGAARDRILGFASASAATMAVVAQVAGGQLVQHLGWQASFWLYALALPVLACAWRGATDRAGSAVAVHPGLTVLARTWPVLFLTLVLTIGLFMPGIQGPFLLVGKGVTDPATIGMILASYSLAASLVASCYGMIAARLPMSGQIALACLGMGVGCAAFAASPGSATLLAASCVVIGAGVGLVEPFTVTLVLQRTVPDSHTRAIGMLLSAVFLGQFLNPVLVGPLRSAFGDVNAFGIVGAFFLCLALAAASGAFAGISRAAVLER